MSHTQPVSVHTLTSSTAMTESHYQQFFTLVFVAICSPVELSAQITGWPFVQRTYMMKHDLLSCSPAAAAAGLETRVQSENSNDLRRLVWHKIIRKQSSQVSTYCKVQLIVHSEYGLHLCKSIKYLMITFFIWCKIIIVFWFDAVIEVSIPSWHRQTVLF